MTDVDDEKLGELFHAAASDPAAPAPAFDHAAVVRASRRARMRRRVAVIGAGLALVAVAGIGRTLPGGSGDGGDAASVAAPMVAPGEDARSRPDAPPADPRAQRQAPPPLAEGAPGAAPAPEAASGRGQAPLGPGTTECADRQDPALRALVEQVLPEVIGAPEAATTMECRPGGERGVNLEVRDGAATGLLTVQYLPSGTEPKPVEGALEAPTASGGTVLVSTRAEEPTGPTPFADRLNDLVTYLAPRL
jgi:hypothetical protein